MSAALQLTFLNAAASAPTSLYAAGDSRSEPKQMGTPEEHTPGTQQLAFYRKHTEKVLRRYLYASMLVGRTPSLLQEPIGRGWVSSRPIRTFEDAVIFVLDVETCLKQLQDSERDLLSRIVLQEYTMEETAVLLRLSVRTTSSRLGQALDHLTRTLIDAGLLILPY